MSDPKISWNPHFCPDNFCPKWPLTFRPVGPMCPNINQTWTEQTFTTSCWVTTPTTRQKKKFARPRGLVRKWTWPPCPGEFSCQCPNLDPTCGDVWDQNNPNLSDFASNIMEIIWGPHIHKSALWNGFWLGVVAIVTLPKGPSAEDPETLGYTTGSTPLVHPS